VNKLLIRTVCVAIFLIGLALAYWIWPSDDPLSGLRLTSFFVFFLAVAAASKAWLDTFK
jgi:hypothetical protein